eukprot:1160985-Pelagomonas_calceolata.AAC.8
MALWSRWNTAAMTVTKSALSRPGLTASCNGKDARFRRHHHHHHRAYLGCIVRGPFRAHSRVIVGGDEHSRVALQRLWGDLQDDIVQVPALNRQRHCVCNTQHQMITRFTSGLSA